MVTLGGANGQLKAMLHRPVMGMGQHRSATAGLACFWWQEVCNEKMKH